MKIPFKLVDEIRVKNPLIHNITNIVVANDSANGLLAIGASPFMSSAIPEMEEVAGLADAVVLNIGTLDEALIEAMKLAGAAANRLGKPVVIDPVGAGATAYRKQAIQELLEAVKPTLIRGNAGEIAVLAGADWSAKGVDAGTGSGDLEAIAKKLANQLNCLVVVSGEKDIVTDGDQLYLVANGTPLFPKMTGSGCLHSCVCGAYLASTDKEEALEALVLACSAYAIAGEKAAEALEQPVNGSFRTHLLDELSVISAEVVEKQAKLEKR